MVLTFKDKSRRPTCLQIQNVDLSSQIPAAQSRRQNNPKAKLFWTGPATGRLAKDTRRWF